MDWKSMHSKTEVVKVKDFSKCQSPKNSFSLITVSILLYFMLSPLESILTFAGGTALKYISLGIAFLLTLEMLFFQKNIRLDTTLKTLMCLIALSWLSIFWSINVSVTLSRNVAYSLLPLFFFVVYIANISKKSYIWLDHAIITGGILAVLYLLSTQGLNSILEGRLTLTEGNDPNNFAAQLLLQLFIAFKLFIETKHILIKMVYGIVLLLLVAIFLLSGSRGGLISLFSIVLVFVTFSLKQGNYKQTLIFIAIAITMIYFLYDFIPQHIVHRIFYLDSYMQDFEGFGTRSRIWQVVITDVLPSLPLWGLGSGTAPLRISTTAWFFGYFKGIHNTYLNFLIEYGLFGLPMLIFFITGILKKNIMQKNVYRISILVGIIVIAFFLDSYAKKFFWNSLMYCSMGFHGINNNSCKKNVKKR